MQLQKAISSEVHQNQAATYSKSRSKSNNFMVLTTKRDRNEREVDKIFMSTLGDEKYEEYDHYRKIDH